MDTLQKEDNFEDKNMKFDIPGLPKKLSHGEFLLHTVSNVEDSKGSPGDKGCLLATNLRIIWHSLSHRKHNLSVGYEIVSSMSLRNTYDKVSGPKEMLFVPVGFYGSRFEFHFAHTLDQSSKTNLVTFENVIQIHKLYQRTFLYRDLKLRCAILNFGHLILLPQEVVINNLQGVMNLSSDQGNLGVFILTNIRLVWYSDTNDKFNMSISYRQIGKVCVRMSKYGQTLVICTSENSGAYILGFRVDPPERLLKLEKEIISLQRAYAAVPNYGVNMEFIHKEKVKYNTEEVNDLKSEDFVEIDMKQENQVNSKINNYLAKSSLVKDSNLSKKGPVYNKHLGLAMAPIPDGYTLQDLWTMTTADE